MALGGLLSLKWNNHCSTFLHILSSLHKKHSYDDATVACDGKLYPVHKLVLSTCSDYFQEMFEKTLGKHPVIVLKDIKSEVFEALLKYMYIGEVNVVQEKLSELINAAECLKIKGLAAPDEEPEQCSHSNRSGHSSSGKRKQDQYHSDNSAPPNKVHRSHSSSGEITKNTSHGISNNSTSSSSSDLNKSRSTASYHHHTSKSSYQDNSIASNNSVENSKRRRSENTSHRSGNPSRETISSVQDDDIEEIPTGNVKQEPVDFGDDPLDEDSARRASEGAEGREEDSMGEKGDASAELDQPDEQDSKYGILDDDDGGVDRDHWESPLMTKEDEDAEAFSSLLGGESNTSGGGEGGTAAGQSKVQEDDSAGVSYHGLPPFHPDLLQTHLHLSDPHHSAGSYSSSSSTFEDSSCLPTRTSTRKNPQPLGSLLQDHQGSNLASGQGASGVPVDTAFGVGTLDASNYLPNVGVEEEEDETVGSLSCNQCQYRTDSQTLLVEHYWKRHSDDRPFSCDLCSYRSTTRHNLERHVKQHTGEKNFGCPFCEYRSISKHHVLRHKMSKHPEIPGDQVIRFPTSRN